MASCIFHDITPATHERQLFEIVERAYNSRQRVLVFAADNARAAALDRTLWILRQEAFIPHRVFAAEEQGSDVPVAIVTREMNPNSAQLLVADGHCGLEFASQFESIHEFVNRSSAEMHQACRERFRQYRALQIPVDYIQPESAKNQEPL